MSAKTQEFDFESWMALAQTDPEEFERRRQEEIESAIAKAPEDMRDRLRGLQWRIDMERRRCKTPLAACMRLNSLMWDFVYAENGFLATLNACVRPGESTRKDPESFQPKARIIPFRPARAAKTG